MINLNQEIVEFDVALDCNTIETVNDSNLLYNYIQQKHNSLIGLINRDNFFKLVSMVLTVPSTKIIIIESDAAFIDFINDNDLMIKRGNINMYNEDINESERLSSLLSMSVKKITDYTIVFPFINIIDEDVYQLMFDAEQQFELGLSNIVLNVWSAADVYGIMTNLGIDPSPANIDRFLSEQNRDGFSDIMGSYGNEILTQMVEDTFKLNK